MTLSVLTKGRRGAKTPGQTSAGDLCSASFRRHTPSVSSLTDPPSPTPGWYPEPETPGVLRYWNGSSWEEWRQPVVAPGVAPSPTNGLAVTSLVFSLVGVFLDLTILLAVVGVLSALVGWICGARARRRATTQGRRGMALWGYWLGVAGVAVPVGVFLLVLVLGSGLTRHRLGL